MTRTSIPVVLALVVGLVAAPVAASALQGGTATPTASPGDEIRPGEQLSGVVAVQNAELDGELAERSFDVRVARANSSAAKADAVAAEFDDASRQLERLRERKQQLQQARENGSISEGRYRAEMAELAARTETVKRLANRSEAVARGLPEAVLAERGVDVAAIRQLRRNAGNVTGPEVAEIARSIAGDGVGGPMAGTGKPGELPDGANRSADGGPGAPDDRGRNASDASDGPANPTADAPNDGARGNATNASEAMAVTDPGSN